MPDSVPLRILLVEDEALVAMLIEDALALHDHVVVGVADTAAQALEIAANERPDIALCDIRLAQGDNGVDVAERLAERGIPSLFLSGNCPDCASDPLIVGCLPKPFHTGHIGLAVQAVRAIAAGEVPGVLPAGLKLYVSPAAA